jgi:hypothetical protein
MQDEQGKFRKPRRHNKVSQAKTGLQVAEEAIRKGDSQPTRPTGLARFKNLYGHRLGTRPVQPEPQRL